MGSITCKKQSRASVVTSYEFPDTPKRALDFHGFSQQVFVTSGLIFTAVGIKVHVTTSLTNAFGSGGGWGGGLTSGRGGE